MNTTTSLRFLTALFLVCALALSCSKKSNTPSPTPTPTPTPGDTTTYNFNWTHVPLVGIPPYAVYVRFNFASTAPFGSTYLWSFGDGSTSTVSHPTHDYQSLDTFKVSLTVNGDTSRTIVKYLNLNVYMPHSFTYTGTLLPDSVLTFTSNVLPDSTFLWEFGDGTTSTAVKPTHGYAASGTYYVKLTINGNAATAVTTQVHIANDPGYTHLIAGSRVWHHTFYYHASSGTTSYPRADTTFGIAYVNPVMIKFGATSMYYSAAASTSNKLTFSSTSTDQWGNTHTTSLYFYHLNDSIGLEKYDRISAGVMTQDVWSTP